MVKLTLFAQIIGILPKEIFKSIVKKSLLSDKNKVEA